jgi:hypothetical protein
MAFKPVADKDVIIRRHGPGLKGCPAGVKVTPIYRIDISNLILLNKIRFEPVA